MIITKITTFEKFGNLPIGSTFSNPNYLPDNILIKISNSCINANSFNLSENSIHHFKFDDYITIKNTELIVH